MRHKKWTPTEEQFDVLVWSRGTMYSARALSPFADSVLGSDMYVDLFHRIGNEPEYAFKREHLEAARRCFNRELLSFGYVTRPGRITANSVTEEE